MSILAEKISVLRYRSGLIAIYYTNHDKFIEKEKNRPELLAVDVLNKGEDVREFLETRRSVSFQTSSGVTMNWTADDIRQIEREARLKASRGMGKNGTPV